MYDKEKKWPTIETGDRVVTIVFLFEEKSQTVIRNLNKESPCCSLCMSKLDTLRVNQRLLPSLLFFKRKKKPKKSNKEESNPNVTWVKLLPYWLYQCQSVRWLAKRNAPREKGKFLLSHDKQIFSVSSPLDTPGFPPRRQFSRVPIPRLDCTSNLCHWHRVIFPLPNFQFVSDFPVNLPHPPERALFDKMQFKKMNSMSQMFIL